MSITENTQVMRDHKNILSKCNIIIVQVSFY